jgi:hypothetical protein
VDLKVPHSHEFNCREAVAVSASLQVIAVLPDFLINGIAERSDKALSGASDAVVRGAA